MSAVIEIEPTHMTSTGQRYRVWHDGEVLIESTRDGFCEAARKLSAMGVTGRLQMKMKGSDRVTLTGLIAVAATMRVSETEKHGPKMVKWKPHFMAEATQ